MNRILVTGGSGFIGSQVVKNLSKEGYELFVVDRKINPWTYTYVNKDHIHEGDYLEAFQLDHFKFDTIIHLASDILVSGGEINPSQYYENNVTKFKEMLDLMQTRNVKNILFSSSGSIYGNQSKGKYLTEDLFYDPQCTYASTKVAGELLIKDYSRTHDFKYVIFRYFNAAGADPECEFGYIQNPATHIIPIICNKINKHSPVMIYGNDYPTVDGTCVRDYVHISDIADAHKQALLYLESGGKSDVFNIGGSDTVCSVKQLTNNVYNMLNRKSDIIYSERRPGDVAELVANIDKIKTVLNWAPKYNIEDIIQHAWNWELKYHGV